MNIGDKVYYREAGRIVPAKIIRVKEDSLLIVAAGNRVIEVQADEVIGFGERQFGMWLALDEASLVEYEIENLEIKIQHQFHVIEECKATLEQRLFELESIKSR